MRSNSKPHSFEDIASKQRTRGAGCPRCGAEKNRGSVGSQLQEFGADTAGFKGGRRVRSKHVSMCESCCVEVYVKLEEFLLKETKLDHLIGVRHT